MIDQNPSAVLKALKMAFVWLFALAGSVRNEIIQQMTYNQNLIHLKLLN